MTLDVGAKDCGLMPCWWCYGAKLHGSYWAGGTPDSDMCLSVRARGEGDHSLRLFFAAIALPLLANLWWWYCSHVNIKRSTVTHCACVRREPNGTAKMFAHSGLFGYLDGPPASKPKPSNNTHNAREDQISLPPPVDGSEDSPPFLPRPPRAENRDRIRDEAPQRLHDPRPIPARSSSTRKAGARQGEKNGSISGRQTKRIL